jgi:hypothetical protein
VDVGRLELPTPCLQIRFRALLNVVEFCCFEVIQDETFVALV